MWGWLGGWVEEALPIPRPNGSILGQLRSKLRRIHRETEEYERRAEDQVDGSGERGESWSGME